MNDDEVREVALGYQKQVWNAALRQARDRAEAEDFFQEMRTLLDRAAAARPKLKEVAHRAQAAEDQRDAAWWKALGPKVGSCGGLREIYLRRRISWR